MENCRSVERWLWQEKESCVGRSLARDVASLGKETAGQKGDDRELSSYKVLAFEEESKKGINLKVEQVNEEKPLERLNLPVQVFSLDMPQPLVKGASATECAVTLQDCHHAVGGGTSNVTEEQHSQETVSGGNGEVQLECAAPEGMTACCGGGTEVIIVQLGSDINTSNSCESLKENIERHCVTPEKECNGVSSCSEAKISKSPSSDKRLTDTATEKDAEETQSAIPCLSSGKNMLNHCVMHSERENPSGVNEKCLEPAEQFAATSVEQFETSQEEGMIHKCSRNRVGDDESPEIGTEKNTSIKCSYSRKLCNKSQGRDCVKSSSLFETTPPVDSSVLGDAIHSKCPVERDAEYHPRSLERTTGHSRGHSRKEPDQSNRSPERNIEKYYRYHKSSEKDSKHDREFKRRSCEMNPESPEDGRRRVKRRSGSHDRCARERREVGDDKDASGRYESSRSKTRHADSYNRGGLQQTESSRSGREERDRRRDQDRMRRHNADTRYCRLPRSSCDGNRYLHKGSYDRNFARSSSLSKRSLVDVSPDGDPCVWPHSKGRHSPCWLPGAGPNAPGSSSKNLSEVPRWSQANGNRPAEWSRTGNQPTDDPCNHPVTSQPLPPGLEADRCVVLCLHSTLPP